MLYDALIGLYDKFRLVHYRSVFSRIREKAGSLSATEAYAADVIHLLKNPTIKQFSEYLGISQPNATYKVVSNSYTAQGKDGYLTFKTVTDSGRALDTYLDYAQSFVDYVKKVGTLNKLPVSDYSTQNFYDKTGALQQ